MKPAWQGYLEGILVVGVVLIALVLLSWMMRAFQW